MKTIKPAYQLSTVLFVQDQEQPHIINIFAEDEFYINRKIGSFNFYYKEGYVTLLDGKRKDYKRFNAIMNVFFKYDDMFGWTDKDIKASQETAKQMIKEENKQLELERKETQTNKATDYLNKVKNRDNQTIAALEMFTDMSDTELLEVINRTFKNAITNQLANDILNAIRELKEDTTERTVQENNEEVIASSQDTNEPVQYYFYNQTFDTYMEAYNHALNNLSPVTMVIPSNHPYMTNERLQHIEYEYTFSKGNMSYEDMKEYFQYISELPETLDQQDRYYKLKSYIQRYEYKKQQKEERENKIKQYAIDAEKMLIYMVNNGLEIKSKYSMTEYYYRGEKVHYWMSGISTEEYYNGVKKVYDAYFKVIESAQTA